MTTRTRQKIAIANNEILAYLKKPSKSLENSIFTRIYALTENWLLSHQNQLVSPPDTELQDWTQDLTLRVWKSLKNYKAQSNADFTTFAITVIKNGLADKNRYQLRTSRKIHTMRDYLAVDSIDFDNPNEDCGYVRDEFLDADADPLAILENLEIEQKYIAFEQFLNAGGSWVFPLIAGQISYKKACKLSGLDADTLKSKATAYCKLFAYISQKSYCADSLLTSLNLENAEDWAKSIFDGKATIAQISANTGISEIEIKQKITNYLDIFNRVNTGELDALDIKKLKTIKLYIDEGVIECLTIRKNKQSLNN